MFLRWWTMFKLIDVAWILESNYTLQVTWIMSERSAIAGPLVFEACNTAVLLAKTCVHDERQVRRVFFPKLGASPV